MSAATAMLTSNWLLYVFISLVTGNPWLALLIVAVMVWGTTGWWRGRLPNPFAPIRARLRVGELRAQLGANPHNVNVRAELGGLLADRRPAEARALLEEVARRSPELPLPAYHLGVALLNLGETDAGTAAIERALERRADLKFGEPMVRLGDHLLGRGRPTEAVRAYERAVAIHGSHAEAWYKLGAAAQAAGDPARAQEAWREALASTEHAPAFKRRIDRPWRWRAWFALRRG